MQDFTKQVVFLTGAGGHIAAVTAALFVKRGAKVISTDVSFSKHDPSGIDFGSNPVQIHLDVTEKNEVQELIGLIIRKLHRLDVVVNAAGVLNITPFLELSETEWDRVFAINVKGTFLIC